MKKLLIAVFTICLTFSSAHAASAVNNQIQNDLSETKQILKKHVDAAKKDLQKKQEADKKKYTKTDTMQKKSFNETKIAELELQRKTEIDIIDSQIEAKNDEIEIIKKMRISNQEQEKRIGLINTQIQVLEKRKETTKNIYQKRIDFYKGKKITK